MRHILPQQGSLTYLRALLFAGHATCHGGPPPHQNEEIIPCDYDFETRSGGVSKEELNARLVKPLKQARSVE